MVVGTSPVVNTKATSIMLYKPSVLLPYTQPFRFFTSLNKEKLSFSSWCISLSTYNILDLFTEVIVICS
jgi:hypothetical protein